jgi:hypothetical protein
MIQANVGLKNHPEGVYSDDLADQLTYPPLLKIENIVKSIKNLVKVL